MEEYTRLFYERAETSEIAQIWTCRTKTEEVHVLRSIIIPHANSGEQKVSTVVRSDKRSIIILNLILF